MRVYGAMFALRPERVTGELVRVCRPGGIVAMGNWTKEGFVGATFKTFARFLMPPDMPSPLLWGDESVVRQRFGAGVSDLRLTRVLYRFDLGLIVRNLTVHAFSLPWLGKPFWERSLHDAFTLPEYQMG